MDISVVIPCLNEEKTIGLCVKKAFAALKQEGLSGEVVVVDNGSTDQSRQRAKDAGARIVFEKEKGYGSAVRTGIKEAVGQMVIMGDGDDTYNFLELKDFVSLLRNGADLVIGNRLGGKIHKNAMPQLHRYLGTPVLTWVLRLFYGSKISDVNCGMRAFKKEAIERLNLQCKGMEFASEMIIQATIKKLSIEEIPINFFPSFSGRIPHLKTFRDGWRHLTLMLTLSPKPFAVYPRIAFSVIVLVLICVFIYY